MVPGCPAQPCVEPVALPLSAGGVSLRGPASRRTAGAARREPEYELLDTGVVRRGPLLDRRGPLRQGRSRRPAHVDPGHQRRARHRDAARAADGLVPQHLVVGRGRAQARAGRRRRRLSGGRAPVPRRAGADRRARAPTARLPACCSARTRPTTAGSSARSRARPTPRMASTTMCRRCAPPSTPSGTGHQVRILVPGDRAAGRDRRAAAAAAPAAAGARRAAPGDGERRRSAAGAEFDKVMRPAAGRGRRVLRRADPGGGACRRGDGDASGVRRDAVEQAAVLLRRGPLAGRRPDPAAAAAASA